MLETRNARTAAVVAVLAAIASATLAYAGTGLRPVWWLAWLAAVPVFAVAPLVGRLSTFAVAFAAWALGALNMWTYLRDSVETPLPAVLVITIAPALAFAAVTLLARELSRRGFALAAVVAAPAAWVAVEYLVAVSSPHGTWGNLAYSQVDALPVIQIASVCGLWGVSYLVLLPASAAAALVGTASSREKAVAAGVALGIVAVALGFGAWRLRDAAPAGPVPVAVAAADTPASPKPASDPAASETLAAYAREAGALGDRGARYVVFPETVAAVDAADFDATAAPFADAARRTGSWVVVGLDCRDADAERNAAVAFGPNGETQRYAKRHLLPAFEGRYTAGAEPSLVDGSTGVAICKDMDFPALGREYARRGAGLLLVPAWDFDVDDWLHSRMAMMRGVESGFAIARAARGGALTVSDARGRVLVGMRSDASRLTSVAATVGAEPGATLYARFGDWFAWLCVGLAVASVLLLLRRKADRG